MIITQNKKVLLSLTDMMYQRSHMNEECAGITNILGQERKIDIDNEQLEKFDFEPFNICRNMEEKRRMLVAAMLVCAACGEKNMNQEVLHRNSDLISAMYHYTKELPSDYITENPYIRNLSLIPGNDGSFTFSSHKINAYVPFAYGPVKQYREKEVQPAAYFNEALRYPVIMKDGKNFFSMNGQSLLEYDSLLKPVSKEVLICGLKAGYLTYMLERKQSVTSITVVEHNAEVIRLFKEQILPQFENPGKIHIIHEDAYEYLKREETYYDWIINDLYQDFHDGLDSLIRMKTIENTYTHTRFLYWKDGDMLDTIRAALLADMAASLSPDYDRSLNEMVTDQQSQALIHQIHKVFENYRIDTVRDYMDLYDDRKLHKILKKQSLQYGKRYNKI